MGDIAKSIFGGSPVKEAPSNLPSLNNFLTNPDANQLPPTVVRGVGAQPMTQPQQGVQGEQDPDLVVEGFKPKKPSTIQTLADIFLFGGPVFKNKVKNENLQRAMEGYTSDPLKAIQRVMNFDAKLGADLYEKYADNKRADDTAEALIDERRQKTINTAASVFRSVQPGDEAGFLRARGLAERIMKARGIDPEEYGLPESLEDVPQWSAIGMTVDQQEDNSRADLNTKSLIIDRAERRQMTQERYGVLNDQGERRLAETERKNKAAEAQRERKAGGKASGGAFIRDKEGRIVGQIAPSGTAAKIIQNGRTYAVRVKNGKLTNERIPELEGK